MAFSLIPKDEKFFALFEQSADNVRKGANLLAGMLDNFTDVAAKAAAVKAVEEAGDEYTYQIILKLNKTFITPIDREDILAIARGLDDIIDFIDASAARLASYNVVKVTPEAREFGRLLVRAGEHLVEIMRRMQHRNFDSIHEPTVAINRVENEGDQVLRRAIAGLFAGGHDPLDVIKWKEIYETLEEATDKFEELANLVEGVVVKNT